MSISARSERVARGSPSTTFSPRAFVTVTAYFGGRTGAGASLDLSGSGVSGGASSGLTTEVSADIIFQKARWHQFKPRTVKPGAEKGSTNYPARIAGQGCINPSILSPRGTSGERSEERGNQ